MSKGWGGLWHQMMAPSTMQGMLAFVQSSPSLQWQPWLVRMLNEVLQFLECWVVMPIERG